MSRPPRGLTAEEHELWRRLAQSVTPFAHRRVPLAAARPLPAKPVAPPPPAATKAAPRQSARPAPPPPRSLDSGGLDAAWERRLAKAAIAPDFTIDLHGDTLDAAHRRLEHGLHLARSQQARIVLVITGRPRPVEAADRGSRRGAIRSKVLDWLALGSHGPHIAAIRTAHPRHGGPGALYVVLRRVR